MLTNQILTNLDKSIFSHSYMRSAPTMCYSLTASETTSDKPYVHKQEILISFLLCYIHK